MIGQVVLYGVCIGFASGALVAGLLRACAAHFPSVGPRFWRAATWAAPCLVAGMAAVGLVLSFSSGATGPSLASRQVGVVSLVVAAAILIASASRMPRAARPGPPRSFASSSGGLGLLLILSAAAGFIGHAAGVPGGALLGPAGIALYVVLVVVEIRRGKRSFDGVRARLADARPWPLPKRPGPSDGVDPHEDDRATGRWGDAKIWVALVHGGATLKVALDRWPTSLAVLPRRRSDGPHTGDPDFDDAVDLVGDAAAWRPLLTADVRRLVVELVGRRRGHLDPAAKTLELLLPEAEAGGLSAVLDRMAALADALPPAGGAAGLTARVADEPLAAVRRGHYEWLLAQGEGGPLVLRAAADDPDPAIAAWARSQLPPDGGAYR